MSEFAEVEEYLRDVFNRADDDAARDRIKRILRDIKAHAVANDDQESAKLTWCYEQILDIQENYLSAYREMKAGSYDEAWCTLERVEIGLHFLERHYRPEEDEFRTLLITKHVKQFQALFPYKLFLSPEFLETERVCTICDRPVSIRHPCGHKVGEIYNGEMCGRRITKVELLGFSFVKNPLQKYSVPFLVDNDTEKSRDHYNYALVRFVIDRLRNPFDAWDMRWTRVRHPHSRYEHVSPEEDCPCESGKPYRDCCLPESGVLRPHCEVFFSVPPPEHLPALEYTD